MWLDAFDEYKGRELWISGESYGGVYVPMLSWQIHEWNNKQIVANTTDKKINLQGFAVGNGVTNWRYDTFPALPATLHGFNMIPTPMFFNFTDNGCVIAFDGSTMMGPDAICQDLFNQMQNNIVGLNPYDLYKPAATNHGSKKNKDRHTIKMKEYFPWLKNDDRVFAEADLLTRYLNNATVREPLHIPSSVWDWSGCTGRINYTILPEASEWIYYVLKDNGYKLLHYSGDTDGVLPTWGTKQWIETLKWPILSNFTMWKTDDQVSGMYRQYDGL